MIAFAWSGSLAVPFLLDDNFSIVSNAALRKVGSVADLLVPSGEAGLGGRPTLKLSFLLNYAAGGLSVRGYHLVNLLIHCGSAIALFGLIRRTLLTPALHERYGRDAAWLAFAVAALWALHPVNTQAVTYISQRAESLMGCFYLLTLYLFLRSATTSQPRRWQVGAVVTCLLGMGTKEVMVTAPLLVLLYDRTFLAGSFREALKVRGRLYAALAATWLVLPFLLVGLGARGAGTGLGVDPLNYALTESRVVLDYLRLAFVPCPLVFDYPATFVHGFSEVAGFVVVLVLLLVGVAVLLVRRPRWGFFGAWFFVILAPTSSVVPITGSSMAESRLYLPLVAVASAVVFGLYRLLERKAMVVVVGLTLLFGFLVNQRNRDYLSAESLWRDTIHKQPLNARAHSCLGVALLEQGRLAEAVPALEASLKLDPTLPAIEHLLANALASLGRFDEAAARYQHTLKEHPDETTTRGDLAQALVKLGRVDEALQQARLAVTQRPRDHVAHYSLAYVFERRGDETDAIEAYKKTLQLAPDLVAARLSLGELLLKHKRLEEAWQHFDIAATQAPQQLAGHRGLIETWLAGGQAEDAQRYAATLTRRSPDSPDAYFLLGRTEIALGHSAAAAVALRRALQLRPAFPEASAALGALSP